MAERCVNAEPRGTSLCAINQAQKHERRNLSQSCVDQSYVKVKTQWSSLYRTVFRERQTLEFMLTEYLVAHLISVRTPSTVKISRQNFDC